MDVTIPTPQQCDDCGKTFTRDFNVTHFWHRLCPECLKKSREQAAPRDCKFCQGKGTAEATYRMESEYGSPYVCTVCLKDENGLQYESMPENISYAVIQGYGVDDWNE